MIARLTYSSAVRSVCLLLVLISPCSGFAASSEDVKAAVIINLLRFTVWPLEEYSPGIVLESDDEAASPQITELSLCSLVNAFPMREALDRLQGRRAGQRTIVVSHLRSVAQLKRFRGQCQALFVGDMDYGEVQRVFAMLADEVVLMIGEMPGFAQIGGDINLRFEGSRIRIQANIEALAGKGLSLDARLLSLIEAVE